MATVTCRECGAAINEASNVPFDQREECPNCGSRSRSFVVGVVDQAFSRDDGLTSVQGQPGDAVTVAVPTAGAGVAPRRGWTPPDSIIVADHTFIVTYTQTPGGAWLALVYDEGGSLIGLAPQDDTTNALLAVIEKLIPPGE